MHSWQEKKAKIVCTLGPSSNTPEKIKLLIEAGMDVARLNFSHGDHNYHRALRDAIRQASKETGKYVAILQDLQGPKLRIGKLKEAVELKNGDEVFLFPEGTDPGDVSAYAHALPLSKEIAEPVSKSVKPGARILFDDGKLIAKVKSAKPPTIVVSIEVGGKLTSNKGINIPGTPLPIPACTDKDFEDLKFGLSLGVDIVALSFVRNARDIEKVKEFIRKESQLRPLVFSKIEREEAVDDIDPIIDVSDGIMIARGDMAVELGAERVPVIQKQLIKSCRELGVPVITATQMLESMITSPTPTRAEASDVANAVFDGTDAVMLSAETASGQFPVETVSIMSTIIREAEKNMDKYGRKQDVLPLPGSVVDSVEFSASRIAHHVGAHAIACITHSGMAARTLAKYRPDNKIIAIMDNEEALRKLAVVWGVYGVVIENIVATDDIFTMVENVLKKYEIAQNDDLVVITAGVPTLRRGTTNMVKVHRIGAVMERGAHTMMTRGN